MSYSILLNNRGKILEVYPNETCRIWREKRESGYRGFDYCGNDVSSDMRRHNPVFSEKKKNRSLASKRR